LIWVPINIALEAAKLFQSILTVCILDLYQLVSSPLTIFERSKTAFDCQINAT